MLTMKRAGDPKAAKKQKEARASRREPEPEPEPDPHTLRGLVPELFEIVRTNSRPVLPLEYAFPLPSYMIGTAEHAIWRERNAERVLFRMAARVDHQYLERAQDVQARSDRRAEVAGAEVSPAQYAPALADVMDALFLKGEKAELYALFAPLLRQRGRDLRARPTVIAAVDAHLQRDGQVIPADVDPAPREDRPFLDLLVTAVGSNIGRLAYAAGRSAWGSTDFMPILHAVMQVHGARDFVFVHGPYSWTERSTRPDFGRAQDSDAGSAEDFLLEKRYGSYFGMYILGVYDGRHWDKMAYVHRHIIEFTAAYAEKYIGSIDGLRHAGRRTDEQLLTLDQLPHVYPAVDDEPIVVDALPTYLFHTFMPYVLQRVLTRIVERDDAVAYRHYFEALATPKFALDAIMQYTTNSNGARQYIEIGPAMATTLSVSYRACKLLEAFRMPIYVEWPVAYSEQYFGTEERDEVFLIADRNIATTAQVFDDPFMLAVYLGYAKLWRTRRLTPAIATVVIDALRRADMREEGLSLELCAAGFYEWAQMSYRPELAAPLTALLAERQLSLPPPVHRVSGKTCAQLVRVGFEQARARFLACGDVVGERDGNIEIVMTAAQWRDYLAMDGVAARMASMPSHYYIRVADAIAKDGMYDACFRLVAKLDADRVNHDPDAWRRRRPDADIACAYTNRGPRFFYEWLLGAEGMALMADLDALALLDAAARPAAYKKAIDTYLTEDYARLVMAVTLKLHGPLTMYRALRVWKRLFGTQYALRQALITGFELNSLVLDEQLALKFCGLKACPGFRALASAIDAFTQDVVDFRDARDDWPEEDIPTAEYLAREADEIRVYVTAKRPAFDYNY